MKPRADDSPVPVAGGPHQSRRHDVRFEPPAQLVCTVDGSSARFVVRDLSLGGLAVWSSLPLRRDGLHEFRLTLGKLTVVRRARAVHCKRQEDGRWILGIAFADESRPGPTVEDLIDLITHATIEFS